MAAANGCRRGEKLLPPATAENDYQEHHGCGPALAHGQEWACPGPRWAPWRPGATRAATASWSSSGFAESLSPSSRRVALDETPKNDFHKFTPEYRLSDCFRGAAQLQTGFKRLCSKFYSYSKAYLSNIPYFIAQFLIEHPPIPR